MTSSTQKFDRKIQIGISCTNVDRKNKIKRERYCEVNYSFMKPFSQNFEVLTQQGDVINPKVARKKAQTCISFANGDTNLQMYLFLQSFYLYINSS